MKKAYKIMSINVLGKYPKHEAEDEITNQRMKTLAECVEHYAPCSVGLQEYGTQNRLFLPLHLPSRYAFVDFGHDWVPTFYDTEQLEVELCTSKKLTTVSNQSYRFTVAVFKHKADGSLAYIHGNLHLEYKDKETRLIDAEEINTVLRELFAQHGEYRNIPLVITGDYNATLAKEPEVYSIIAGDYDLKSAEDIAPIAEKGQFTFHDAVGVSKGAGNAVDHVLVDCDTTEVALHNVIKEDDYPEILSASDHYPLLVEFHPISK